MVLPLIRLAALAVAVLAPCTAARAAEPTSYERKTDAAGNLVVTTRFVNFNRDALAILFRVDREAIRQSMAEYGYLRSEIQALTTACGGPCNQAQYDQHVQKYYRSRGLMPRLVAPGNTRVAVDITAAVARNRQRMRPVAAVLDHLGKLRSYGSEQTLGALVAMVQTALEYRRPPKQEGGREIVGFYPPPRALEVGWGDCDTKSALLAAVMANFPGVRMVGVHIPGHYLVGIGRVPRHGDAYVEFNGEPYVLIESSGPAWLPPGMIGDATQAALATMAGVRIDPLF